MPMRYANCRLHLNDSCIFPNCSSPLVVRVCGTLVPRFAVRVRVANVARLFQLLPTATSSTCRALLPAACCLLLTGDVFGPFATARSVVVACCRWSGVFCSALCAACHISSVAAATLSMMPPLLPPHLLLLLLLLLLR